LVLGQHNLDDRIKYYQDKEQEAGEELFIYFFGDLEKETCKSWCGDCRRVDSIIRSTLDKLPCAVLLEVPVGNRAEWKTDDNIYRNHHQLRLTNIPTLIKWTRTGPGEKLVESEIDDQKKLENFVGV